MGHEAMHKAWRLLALQRYLFRTPRGYRTSELADLFNVGQRTINRDLQDLQSAPFRLPLVQEEAPDWRWHLMAGARFQLPPLQLTLQEGAALYLAARLLDQASDEPNPFVNRALEALAKVLPAAVGDEIQRLVTARPQQEAGSFADIFEVVTLGWATGRVVHIWHRSANSEHIHDYRLHPYLIEASAVGYATYAIGWASWFTAVHTFKLERIVRAELTAEVFEIPPNFDGEALLRTAWGIAYAEPGAPLERVRLKFSPDVTRRVKESHWHPSQELADTSDGGCVLTVEVGHAWEMVPWIRGWGAACEVLAPRELRERVAEELKQAAALYG